MSEFSPGEFPPDVEQAIADLSTEDFNALLARTRPPEESRDPKVRAALALKSYRAGPIRSARRLDGNNPPPSNKEEAVAMLRSLGHHTITEDDR